MNQSRLGQVLVAEGLISDEQLSQAVAETQNNGASLLEGLVQLNYIEEEPLANFVAHQFGLETCSLAEYKPTTQAKQLIPGEIAHRFRVIPTFFDRKTLRVAAANPGDIDQEALRRAARLGPDARLVIQVAPVVQLSDVIKAMYPPEDAGGTIRAAGAGAPAGGEITSLEGAAAARGGDDGTESLDPAALMDQMSESVEVTAGAGEAEEYSVDAANEAPVKRMCNYIIHEAVRRRASDIHLNPTARGLTIRFRIDGTLQTMPSPPPSMRRGVIARYKVMANMNITEHRKPQDGRIKIKVIDKTIDLRVSVIPQMEGENVVMRILDQSSLQFNLKNLGFEQFELDTYYDAIHAPYGLVLHTGPTGSGKTTTLYSALNAIYDTKKSFVTLEDPVEYDMPGVVQVQMENEAGLDFATALRSALRQDPNVMMVGEIRDKETAGIAITAALTGHLLFSTLHTNDAPSTIARLIDLGVEPGYVGNAVRIIVAQRLMKRVCTDCKEPYAPTDEELLRADVSRDLTEGAALVHGIGCPRCNMTGYKGRVGIYEMLRNSAEIQDLIYEAADTQTIRKVAEAQGMRNLRKLAVEKWQNGLTTIDEVQRVTMGGE